MTSNVQVLGIDAGNGYLKTVSATGERVTESQFARFVGGTNVLTGERESTDTYVPRKYGTTEYVLGRAAVERYGDRAVSTLDLDGRMNRPEFANLLQMALVFAQPVLGESQCLVVTGVPEGESIQAAQRKYEEILRGVNVIQYCGVNRIRDVVHVETLHQPSGLLLDQYLDSEGYVLDEDVMQGSSLLIDIGDGTTDVGIYKGLKKESGFSVRIGVSEVARLVTERIAPLYDAPVTVPDVQAAIRRSETILRIGRKEADISHYVSDAMETAATDAISQIQSRVPDRSSFTRVIVGGGGAAAWQEYVRAWIPDAIITPDQLAIARGFYKFGLARARQLTREGAMAYGG